MFSKLGRCGVCVIAFLALGAGSAVVQNHSTRAIRVVTAEAGASADLAARPLAVTSAQPSALFPGLPTVGATVTGFQFEAMTGVFAPAKTPEAVIRKLNEESMHFVNAAETGTRFRNAGMEPVGATPQEAAARVNDEVALWRRIISQPNFHPE